MFSNVQQQEAGGHGLGNEASENRRVGDPSAPNEDRTVPAENDSHRTENLERSKKKPLRQCLSERWHPKRNHWARVEVEESPRVLGLKSSGKKELHIGDSVLVVGNGLIDGGSMAGNSISPALAERTRGTMEPCGEVEWYFPGEIVTVTHTIKLRTRIQSDTTFLSVPNYYVDLIFFVVPAQFWEKFNVDLLIGEDAIFDLKLQQKSRFSLLLQGLPDQTEIGHRPTNFVAQTGPGPVRKHLPKSKKEKAAKIEKARRNNYLANEEAKRKHEEQIEKNKSNSPSANTTS